MTSAVSMKCFVIYYPLTATLCGTGEAEVTMLNSYLRASKLRRWFQRPDCPPALCQVKRFFDKAFGTGNFAHSEEALEAEENVEVSRHRPPIPEDLRSLLTYDECNKAVVLARCKHDGFVFARSTTHLGNSLVRYHAKDRTVQYGCIKYIYKIDSRIQLVVQRHLPAKGGDPFERYVDFLATVKSPELSPRLECIPLRHVICHFARWTMPSGDVAVVPLYKVCKLSTSRQTQSHRMIHYRTKYVLAMIDFWFTSL